MYLCHLSKVNESVAVINGLDIIEGRHVAHAIASLFQAQKLCLEDGEGFRRCLVEIRAIRHAKYGDYIQRAVMPVVAQERRSQGHACCILGEDPDSIK